ncbi:MAG: hypothetical protein V4574_14770 [Pseudomonadota bacterium]
MIALPPPVPAIVVAAPIPSRNLMVWGDQAAMDAMQAAFEAKGWTWAQMMLGGQTKALVLIPPASVSDAELEALVTAVNAGKYGKLNGGFATFDPMGGVKG